MIPVSGGAGRAYAGYQEAALLGTWHIDYDDSAELGGERYGRGSAVIERSDAFWRLMPITKLVLRVGKASWTWSHTEVSIGAFAEFVVHGDPEIGEWRE